MQLSRRPHGQGFSTHMAGLQLQGNQTPSSGFFRHLNTHAHRPTHTHTASLGVDTHMRTHTMFLTITAAHGINILEKHIKRWHCPLHTGGGHLVMQLPCPTTRVSSTRLVCFGECGFLFCFVFWCPCQATSEPSPSPPPPTNQLPRGVDARTGNTRKVEGTMNSGCPPQQGLQTKAFFPVSCGFDVYFMNLPSLLNKTG